MSAGEQMEKWTSHEKTSTSWNKQASNGPSRRLAQGSKRAKWFECVTGHFVKNCENFYQTYCAIPEGIPI